MRTNLPWWQTGILYHIYPRSFCDSNSDGIGDLSGITQNINYLENLGVDAIWLSPIYPSPDIDFGYDIADYFNIDPKYGTMRDFESLVAESKTHGIRIILDMVLNHTSDQHPWFIQARSSKTNPFRNWYIWQDPGKQNRRPNNWQSRFGGPAWTMDPPTGQYYYHTFFPQQPDLNWRHPDVQTEMMKIIKYWLDKGVDGFRLDVFNAYYKHANFPDNPFKLGIRGFDCQQHLFDCDQPEMMDQLHAIRNLLDSYPEKYVIGETYLDYKGQAAAYSGEKMLHGTFDFSMARTPFKPEKLMKAICGWEKSLAGKAWPTLVLNNHDIIRSATRYEKGETDNRLKLAAIMLLTLRGTPFLYYGEEIGMRDIPIHRSAIKDPVGKRYWPFYKGRDGCRSPMQWSDKNHAGFSHILPWLPVHSNYRSRNVENHSRDKNSLLNLYRNLIQTRRENPALQIGSFTPLELENKQLLTYLRETDEETIFVILNFGKKPAKINLMTPVPINYWRIIFSSLERNDSKQISSDLYIDGEEGLILKAET